MKLYKGEFKSYSVNELSEEAKKRAFNKWSNTDRYFWGDEIRGTLNRFCDVFDIHMKNWEFDPWTYNYRFAIKNDTLDGNKDCLSGIRLATYIWNNYAQYITKGKYYFLCSKTEKNDRFPTMGKTKSRHSRIMTEMDNCPLTGVGYDYFILNPIINCLTYKEIFDNFEELIDKCLDGFFNACKEECAYHESEEYFVEEAQANGYEYDENGNAFYLPYGFQGIA